MIGIDPDDAQQVLADIVTLSQFASLDPDLAELCTEIFQTVSEPEFPGALVPVINEDGSLHINLATQTVSNWRQIKPVLLAFAGPTLTSFNGLPEPFSANDAVSVRIMETQPAVTAVIRFPSEVNACRSGLRAIQRAIETLSRAPQLQRTAPVPTSWLLAQFQDCLNVGKRDAASAVLKRLSSELRLDALNLKFLEVQLLATFHDWDAIVALPEFPKLCVARRTPAVTSILFEALYRTHLAQLFEKNNLDGICKRFEVDVRSLAQPMILVPPPAPFGIAASRIYALEALFSPSRVDLHSLLVDHREALGWLADTLPSPTKSRSGRPAITTPLDGAREALIRVDEIDSNDLVADAKALIARLSEDEIEVLRETMPFRPILSAVIEPSSKDLPTSWIAWLERVADPAFTTALDVARRGQEEWEIGASTADPVNVEALVEALDSALSNALSSDRTLQALPHFVAWLKRDPDFPRSTMSPIYSSLLTLVALGSSRGREVYQSSQVLIEALLTVGVSHQAYKDLITDIEEIAGDGFGVNMVYWALEIVDSFMNAATPDTSARDAMLHRTLARITPIYGRLTKLQRIAIGLLATELGWSLPSPPKADADQSKESMADRLSGKRIAIYSLTESSSRQAKDALEQMSPTVVVDTNADHGGTASLRALAENSDIFVMTWLSAKHAATDFIRQHRGDRTLIYAQGKGFSSILRAVEEHLLD